MIIPQAKSCPIAASQNAVYSQFIQHLKVDPEKITRTTDIPFLPVSFFKTHKIVTPDGNDTQIVFSSSATTGTTQSQHFVHDLSVYEQSFIKGFEHFFGHVPDHCILALLPSYQEREGSSLIYMVDELIKLSGHPQSGYFLNDNEKLVRTLSDLRDKKQKTILIGVTYALLDLAEEYKLDLENIVIMETGGMKGRRKEMVREELHD
ncbi:MAG: acyl transferase, partial [Sphingobacteriales bacterium]